MVHQILTGLAPKMNTQRIGVPNLQKLYKKLPEANEELSHPKIMFLH